MDSLKFGVSFSVFWTGVLAGSQSGVCCFFSQLFKSAVKMKMSNAR